MKTINELFAEIASKSTPLQKDEYLRKAIQNGLEIEVSGDLSSVETRYIRLTGLSDSVWPLTVYILHEGEHIRSQLLEFSKGDKVKLTLRPILGEFHDGEDEQGRPVAFSSYTFQLVSIARRYT